MPFGQKLKIRNYVWYQLYQKPFTENLSPRKTSLGDLRQGGKTGAGIYDAIRPALQNLAPESMQQGLNKLNTHVERAQDKYNTLRNKIDQGEQKVVSNIGQVMGNLKKKNIDIGL